MKIPIDYLFLSNIYFYNKDDITSGKWFYCRCKTLQTCRKLKIYLDDNIDNLIYIGKNVKDQLFLKKWDSVISNRGIAQSAYDYVLRGVRNSVQSQELVPFCVRLPV